MSNFNKNNAAIPSALTVFRELNTTFPNNRYISDWKAQGKKVVGWICNYVPEELIHAAGMLPIRLYGYPDLHNIKDGTERLSTSICSFTRSCMQIMVDGGVDFMDGFIGGACCDGTRRFCENVSLEGFEQFKMYQLDPPFRLGDAATRHYQRQIETAKAWLEESFDVTITDAALEESIRLHNETRRLFRELNELRKLPQPPLTGSEFMEVTNASFAMPKEALNEQLKSLLAELKESGRTVPSGFRIMVSGTPMTNPELFQMIESYGGLIVSEEMCTGSRYYWEYVEEGSGDPMAALASRYLSNYPCARMIPNDNRLNQVQQMIEEWRVDAVISTVVRFCALYGTDLLQMKQQLEETKCPLLELSIEYNEGATEQNRTRVQAFMEMLETRTSSEGGSGV